MVVLSTDLSSAYNNIGVTDHTSTTVGNIDGAGSSLPAQALAVVGVTPGSAITRTDRNRPARQRDARAARARHRCAEVSWG